MTDLTDKLADALEKVLGITNNLHDPELLRRSHVLKLKAAQEALDAYRAQRDGEREVDSKYRRLSVGEIVRGGDEFEQGGIWWMSPEHDWGMTLDAGDQPHRRPLAKGEA